MRRKWPVCKAAEDRLPPKTRRKQPTGNQLAGQQKRNYYADKMPECGDWFLIGTRKNGERLVLATETSPELAEAKRVFFLAQGIEGYVSLVVELSMHSSTGVRNYEDDAP